MSIQTAQKQLGERSVAPHKQDTLNAVRRQLLRSPDSSTDLSPIPRSPARLSPRPATGPLGHSMQGRVSGVGVDIFIDAGEDHVPPKELDSCRMDGTAASRATASLGTGTLTLAHSKLGQSLAKAGPGPTARAPAPAATIASSCNSSSPGEQCSSTSEAESRGEDVPPKAVARAQHGVQRKGKDQGVQVETPVGEEHHMLSAQLADTSLYEDCPSTGPLGRKVKRILALETPATGTSSSQGSGSNFQKPGKQASGGAGPGPSSNGAAAGGVVPWPLLDGGLLPKLLAQLTSEVLAGRSSGSVHAAGSSSGADGAAKGSGQAERRPVQETAEREDVLAEKAAEESCAGSSRSPSSTNSSASDSKKQAPGAASPSAARRCVLVMLPLHYRMCCQLLPA